MGRARRPIGAAGGVAVGTLLLAMAACGFDGVGALDVADDAALAAADVVPTADASSDVTEDPVVLDVRVAVEAAPPPGPCDDPSLVLCVVRRRRHEATVSAGTVSMTGALAAIGNNSPDLGNPRIGALDTLRVYARAKSAAEIAVDARR